MAAGDDAEIGIDWGSASVDDGTLKVRYTRKPPGEWIERIEGVVGRLSRGGSAWGEIKVSKKHVRVAAVTAGSEADLRHLLDSAALQAGAATVLSDEDDDEPAAKRSEADQRMTDAFRAFAD